MRIDSIMNPEIRNAKIVYWWLWLSPILLLFCIFPVYLMVVLISGASRSDSIAQVAFLALLPGVHHLILLLPATLAKNKFVRWHSLQALILAAIQTCAASSFLIAALRSSSSYALPTMCLAFLLFAVVWFGGNLWGQLQASRGDCALMRWTGRGASLPLPSMIENVAPVVANDRSNDLVEIIRFSRDQSQRQEALAKLTRRGLVEEM